MPPLPEPQRPFFPSPPTRVDLSLKSMATAAGVAGAAWVALRLAPVVMVVVVALFLVGTLSPAVDALERRGLRRSGGIAFVFVGLFTGISAVLALTVPALVDQVATLARDAPELQSRLADALSGSRMTAPLVESIRSTNYEALAKAAATYAFAHSTQSAEVVAYLLSAVFLALYVMVDRDRLRGGLFAAVPRRHHIRLSRVLLKLETIVGGYIRGQVVTSVLMGAFTFALLSACRVKAALALGVLAGAADVLPYVGVFLAVGPAVAAAIARGPIVVAVVLCAMLAYEELESRFLVPRIYGRALKLPSSIVLFALLAGGTLMGIPGALLALPVAAAARMLVDELRIDLPGEDVDDSGVRASDTRIEQLYEQRTEGLPAERAAAVAVALTEERAQGKGSSGA